MKVLQINIIKDRLSTGRTISEMHKYLIERGVDSYIAYGHGEKPTKHNEYRIVNNLEYYWHNILSRLFGTQGYHSKRATKRFIGWIKDLNPDVIHLRNIRGNCLHNPVFFSFLSNYKGLVVLTTHDFWLLTGGCPIPSCNLWKTKCIYNTQCPNYPFHKKKMIAKRYEMNKSYLCRIPNLVIQPNSHFSASLVNDSFLKDKKRETIYNWIDIKKFDFDLAIKIKKRIKEKPRIHLVWTSVDDTSERFKRFCDFAKEFKLKYDFYILGNYGDDYPQKYPFINFVGRTSVIEDLVEFYANGDVFLNTSFFETFGKVVVESLACGTPAVVFNNAALPELVDNNCGVIVSPSASNKEINEGIESLLEKRGMLQYKACRNRAEKYFNLSVNCKALLELYIKNKKGFDHENNS